MPPHGNRAGGRCASFPSIVAVGARAALPHANPTKRTVAEADLLLVDWGASGPFYKSDLTRVLPGRKISPKFEQVYGLVKRAQERAIQKIRPGAVAEVFSFPVRGEADLVEAHLFDEVAAGVPAVDGEVEAADTAGGAVMGQSGCGKTTLLRIIAAALLPTSGRARTGSS